MKTIDFSNIYIRGELAVRAGLNFTRLEGKWYRPHEVFSADKHGWPGDWEGRVVLALVLLSQSTHRTAGYLERILDKFTENMNPKGYFGPVLKGMNDEQQMAGNSWALRSLCEYYEWKKDENIKSLAKRIVDNLILPSRGNYNRYPLNPKDRKNSKYWKLSQLQSKNKIHAETSDAGCGFIMLDGVTKAYELFPSPKLKEVIEEMIMRYTSTNFKEYFIQTHATLSGLRGILRYYEITGNEKHLITVKEIFELYKKEAMTEAYGNYNWFGLPRWTEPCGIIDSFILAVMLWKHTRNPEYIEDAHKIYFNAICYGNRYDGSLGSDSCVGAIEAQKNTFIDPVNFETYWCCTMRGGEGFARAIEYNFFTDNDELYVPFYNDCDADINIGGRVLKIREKTGYPYEGNVSFEILENNISNKSSKAIKFNFFAPTFSKGSQINVSINGSPVEGSFKEGFLSIECKAEEGDKIEFDLGLSLRKVEITAENNIKDFNKFMYGPMVLGYKIPAKLKKVKKDWYSGDEVKVFKTAKEVSLSPDSKFEQTEPSVFKHTEGEVVLTPLCDIIDMTKEDSIRQLLFKG